MKHKLLKRGLAVGIAMFVVAGSTIASAASYSTTTEYASEGKVKVITNVTEATDGTQLTYLAYNGESATEESIVYIDQQTVVDSAAKFEYTATLGTEGRQISSTGTKVLYGATGQTTATDGDLGDGVTISAAEGAVNYTVVAVSYLPGESATFTVNVTPGYILTGVSYVMGAAEAVVVADAQAGVAVPAFVITDNVVVTATVEEIAADIVTTTDTQAFYNFTTNGIENDPLNDKFITTVGVLTKAPVGVEFGILFSDAVIDTTATASFVEPSNAAPASGTVVKYKALGYGSDLKYAVKLIDDGEFFKAGQKYYTVPYTKVGDTWTFGTQVTFTAE